jgi:hypothetical protein
METIRRQQTIQKKGELTIRNLPVEAGQQVEVLLLISTPDQSSKTPTNGQTAAGFWAHWPVAGSSRH